MNSLHYFLAILFIISITALVFAILAFTTKNRKGTYVSMGYSVNPVLGKILGYVSTDPPLYYIMDDDMTPFCSSSVCSDGSVAGPGSGACKGKLNGVEVRAVFVGGFDSRDKATRLGLVLAGQLPSTFLTHITFKADDGTFVTIDLPYCSNNKDGKCVKECSWTTETGDNNVTQWGTCTVCVEDDNVSKWPKSELTSQQKKFFKSRVGQWLEISI